MDPQDPQDDDLLARAPEKIIRNANGKTTAHDRYSQEYIRAGARLVAEPANPSLSTEDAIALVLEKGLLSITRIYSEAAKVDPNCIATASCNTAGRLCRTITRTCSAMS